MSRRGHNWKGGDTDASTAVAKPRGRPPLYRPALAEEFLKRVEQGGEHQ
jgi:hypothetical protein